jgi:elongation factor Ts
MSQGKPMPEITAKLVMDLRDETGLPMMKCKQALNETQGDREAAIAWLRKQGLAATSKFEGRETPNGGIGLALADGKGAMVLLGCQTDFVSGNDVFKAFVKELAELALATGSDTVDKLKAQTLNGVGVVEAIAGAIQKIGENLVLVNVAILSGEAVVGYNHGGRIATIVSGTGDAAKIRQVALHVASSDPAPVSLDRSSVPADLVAKEREIIAALPDVASKPEAIRPKIIDGKLGRFYKERVLLEQEMLLDNEKGESVEAYAKRQGIALSAFVRFTV